MQETVDKSVWLPFIFDSNPVTGLTCLEFIVKYYYCFKNSKS